MAPSRPGRGVRRAEATVFGAFSTSSNRIHERDANDSTLVTAECTGDDNHSNDPDHQQDSSMRAHPESRARARSSVSRSLLASSRLRSLVEAAESWACAEGELRSVMQISLCSSPHGGFCARGLHSCHLLLQEVTPCTGQFQAFSMGKSAQRAQWMPTTHHVLARGMAVRKLGHLLPQYAASASEAFGWRSAGRAAKVKG